MAADGVDFPLDAEGKRSTTAVNQNAFAAAVKCSPEAHAAVKGEKKWRFGYAKHIIRQVQVATESEENAYAVAKDGSDYLHSTMEFIRNGDALPLNEAMKKFKENPFTTHTIEGSVKTKPDSMDMPYNGKVLKGEEIKAQAEIWVRKGVIELDTGAALSRVASNPELLDLSKHVFVLFGAGSAMGPFPILMALGAHVVALDLDRPGIWKRLMAIARASPGKLTFPLKSPAPANATDEQLAELAGCNLLAQTPEVRNWLLADSGPLAKNPARPVLGAYCYLDGPLFVKVSMAMDAIIADVVKARDTASKPALAYLCTPTDVHVCTQTSKDAAQDMFRKTTWWQTLLSKVMPFAKMPMSKNVIKGEPGSLPIVDALVKEQGPNYGLAKRLQHWRAILSRKDGCIVSTNIAPSTSTVSVVSNKSFALAFKGMHYFKPVEVFHPDTSNAVMSMLLIHDLQIPQSPSHPGVKLANPMQLFASTSFHGGAWRCGWKFGTIGPPSAVAYLFTSMVVKAWLVLYNVIQCGGWGVALYYFAQQPMWKEGLPPTWERPGAYISPMTYFQSMEIFHAATGMVPSNPVATAMQIASRIIVMQVLNCPGVSPLLNGSPGISLMIGAWSVTEVIRYLFLALNTMGIKIPPLTWIRYSTFLPLYPIGVSGELLSMAKAMPLLAELAAAKTIGAYGIFPPLAQKFGTFGLMAIWASAFPMLYGLMLGQRKKVLAKQAGSSKDKKA